MSHCISWCWQTIRFVCYVRPQAVAESTHYVRWWHFHKVELNCPDEVEHMKLFISIFISGMSAFIYSKWLCVHAEVFQFYLPRPWLWVYSLFYHAPFQHQHLFNSFSHFDFLFNFPNILFVYLSHIYRRKGISPNNHPQVAAEQQQLQSNRVKSHTHI